MSIRYVRWSLFAVAMLPTLAAAQRVVSARDHLPARSRIVPRVDHHQHIAGPDAITAQALDPSLPAVAVPPALDSLLARRAQLAGSPVAAGLDPRVYTSDAQVIDITDEPWYRWTTGRQSAHAIAQAYGRGMRLVPHQFAMDSMVGFVNGVARMTGSEDDAFYFSFGLRRDPATGDWRIAMESVREQPPLPFASPVTARRIIDVMDDAGIERAVILSTSFWLARSSVMAPDEEARVRSEHDWVVREIAPFPHRLIAFCGLNPLREYALRELERCASLPGIRGIKLHFANSRIDVTNPEHVKRLQELFRAADHHGLAIAAHLWVPGGGYGPKHAEIFLRDILPAAPHIPVQIAHMGGGGAYEFDDVTQVYADAITAHDPRMRHVYFDLTTVVTESQSDSTLALLARRLRQIGLRRILFGADTPIEGRPAPVQAWATFRRRMPLTDAELRIIAENTAPYLR